MNYNSLWQWDIRGNLVQWRHALTASALTGIDGLGAYLDEKGLTLVQVRKSLSGIKLGRWGTYPAEVGKMEELAPGLKETVLAWTLESCPVGLAVSPHLGFFRQVTLPRAASENLAQVVAYELDRFLPLPADSLFYGFQVVDQTETEIRLMLMAVPRDQVEECLRLLTEATLRPVAVELAPAAAGKVFGLSARPLPPSWLLLHLEDGSFELTHLQGALVKSFTRGHTVQGKDLSRTILAQVDNLAAERPAPQVLGIYGRGAADFKVGVLKKHELEVIYPSHLPIPGFQPDMNPGEILPALGAGLSCFGLASPGVNLLPTTARAALRLGRFSYTTMLLLVFLGLSCLWGTSAFIHTRVELFRVNRQIAGVSQEAKGVESLLQEGRALAKQMENLHKIAQSPDKLTILQKLTQLVPNNTWLINLRLSKQYVELSGMSKAASDLISLLDKSGFLKKPEFVSPIVTDENKLEHFKIKAEF
jgi:Tfp pilus assembly protein PilN